MWAQFLATLLQVQLPAVNEVSLRVDGAQLDLPGLGESLSSLADLDYRSTTTASPALVLLRTGNTLTRVDPDGFGNGGPPRRAPDDERAPLPRIQPGWIELAQSRDGKELAAIGGDRRDLSRWRGTSSHQLPAFGTKLTKPSYDGRDGLWVAGERDGAPRLWVIDTSSRALAAGQAPGRRHQPARRPPDRVVPGGRGRPAGGDGHHQAGWQRRAGAGRRHRPLPPDGTAQLPRRTAAGRLDAHVGLERGLGRRQHRRGDRRVGRAEPQRPYLVDIGGPATGLQPVPDASSLTTTGGVRGLVVVTGRGVVLSKAGNGWQPLGDGTDLVVPGA